MSEESSTLIPKLYNFLSVKDIDDSKEYFGSDGLSYENLREYLTRFGIKYNDNDFETLCLKIDMDRDCQIKFNEFISYFIMELQNDDKDAERLTITPAIAKSAKVLSTQQRSNVLRIFYIPPTSPTIMEQELTKILSPSLLSLTSPMPKSMMTSIADKDRIISDGCYLSIGCYGDVYVWSFDWKLEQVINVGKFFIHLLN
jgi:hypothetical protein